MTTAPTLATLLATAMAFGCSGPDTSGDDTVDPTPDGPTVTDGRTRCDDTGPARALLVATGAEDRVELFRLEGARVTSTGIRLTDIGVPTQITMRDDGLEALVAYGGFGRPTGVKILTIAPDGSTASLAKSVQLATDMTALSVTYADHDHVVVALGGVTDKLVGLTRGESGFTAGTKIAAPAEYPLAVRGRPGSTDVLLSRSEVGVDDTMDIYRLRADATGMWRDAGAHTGVGPTPIAMAIHPSGSALYVPTGDPQDPPSASNLDAGGLVHAVTIGSDSFTDAGAVKIPRIGSMIAVDPGGRFVVTEGNVYMLDGNGNPNVSSYTFQTVRLTDGALGEVSANMQPTDALLFEDLDVAPTGHLVAMRVMYEGSVSVDKQYPLEVWAQPEWGAWELCSTTYLAGSANVAIGP